MRIFNITFNHKKLYYFGLVLTAISLPLSKMVLSIAMIFLISNWLLEWDFKRKIKQLKQNRAILIFLGVFIIHVIWLFNTTDFGYAFYDIKNKAVLLLYPIIIATSEKLNRDQLKKIIIWFSFALLASTLISTLILIGIIDYPIHSIRNISVFISHIRLSLLINVGIFSLGYFLFTDQNQTKKKEKVYSALLIIWLVIFLFLLKSLTGLIVFFVIFFPVLGFFSFKIKNLIPRLFLQVFLLTIFLLTASYLTHSISRFYSIEHIDFNKLEQYTSSGDRYEHFLNDQQIENGNYVWIYICNCELEKEWNKRSNISYEGKDKNDQDIKTTLIRYLASKGYRKDSVGISKLTNQDIKNIESGMANYIFENKYSIYPIIYQALWEIDVYRKGFNPAGNSITQRFEFLKTASDIIKNNFWLGVGTGDVQKAFDKQYEINKSQLPQKNRLRAHNQYVTFFLSFGMIGFIFLFFCMLYPVFELKAFRNYLFLVFLLIALISFFNEDTLETHIGVTFFSYFYSLFLFGNEIFLKKIKDNV